MKKVLIVIFLGLSYYFLAAQPAPVRLPPTIFVCEMPSQFTGSIRLAREGFPQPNRVYYDTPYSILSQNPYRMSNHYTPKNPYSYGVIGMNGVNLGGLYPLSYTDVYFSANLSFQFYIVYGQNQDTMFVEVKGLKFDQSFIDKVGDFYHPHYYLKLDSLQKGRFCLDLTYTPLSEIPQDSLNTYSGDGLLIRKNLSSIFQKQIQTNNMPQKVYSLHEVDSPPQWEKGNSLITSYLTQEIKKQIPIDCFAKKKISLSFRINENGEVLGYEIIGNDCTQIREQVLQTLQNMGKWAPAQKAGQPVTCEFVVKLSFP